MCIHPDDPAISCVWLPDCDDEDDNRWILESLKGPANRYTSARFEVRNSE
jgi:D-mannonate dehydratase